MADGVARVRIGRVTPKPNQKLHLLLRPTVANEVCQAMREWMADILALRSPPHAFACTAFRWDSERQSYVVSTAWHSVHPMMPLAMLPDMVAHSLRRHMTSEATEREVMHKLGFFVDDPDDCA